MTELESRLEDMEARIAFQENSLQALDEIVTSNNLDLQKLTRELRSLAERLKGFADQLEQSAPGTAEQEVPPHY